MARAQEATEPPITNFCRHRAICVLSHRGGTAIQTTWRRRPGRSADYPFNPADLRPARRSGRGWYDCQPAIHRSAAPAGSVRAQETPLTTEHETFSEAERTGTRARSA